MTQVLTWFSIGVCALLLIGGPYAAIRWHRREGQKARAAKRIARRIDEKRLENAEFTDTTVIPAVRDAAPKQPEGRGRTPDSTASLWPPVPVPCASAAVSPRAAVGTGSRGGAPARAAGGGPPRRAARSPAGRRRAPSSTSDMGGEPRATPPLIRAVP
jgi:hypothetical protein